MSDNDVAGIKDVISRQFGSLTWSDDHAAKWEVFESHLIADAPLYPSARPLDRTDVRRS